MLKLKSIQIFAEFPRICFEKFRLQPGCLVSRRTINSTFDYL